MIIVAGCFDCPLLGGNDFGEWCNHPMDEDDEIGIERDPITHKLITPTWCPLKKESFMISFTTETHENK